MQDQLLSERGDTLETAPTKLKTSITTLGDIGYPINPSLVGYDYKLKIHYVYDIYTTNLSFIQTSKDLKSLGVKNNKFFLKLYDPSLIGVDPYDKSLSQETIKRVIIETVRNPWYYLRELSRIPEQGGAITPGGGIRFQLHRGNLAAIYCYLHNINFYFVIPRQCGKTQSVVAILLWTYLFGTSNSEMSFINKDQEAANGNLKRMKEQRSLLPEYMQQKYQFIDGEVKQSKGTDAIQKIENPINGNRVVTKPKAATLAKAENIGRGNTSPIQYFDEGAVLSGVGEIAHAERTAVVDRFGAGPEAHCKSADVVCKHGEYQNMVACAATVGIETHAVAAMRIVAGEVYVTAAADVVPAGNHGSRGGGSEAVEVLAPRQRCDSAASGTEAGVEREADFLFAAHGADGNRILGVGHETGEGHAVGVDGGGGCRAAAEELHRR